MRSFNFASVLVLTFLLAWSLPAGAHTSTRTSIEATREGKSITLQIEATNHELGNALGLNRGDTDATPAELDAARLKAYRMFARAVTVHAHGEPCRPTDGGLTHGTRGSDPTSLQTIVYECPRRDRIEIRYSWYFERDPLHQSFVQTRGAQGGDRFILTAERRTHALDLEPSTIDNITEFGLSGIEHIYTGYDHILFLLALLLMSGMKVGESGVRAGLGYAAKVITGFTMGHSVTLVMAAVGFVDPNSRVIESGIAASIVYVAVENIMVLKARPRVLLTAVFGLIHGFGFAGVLAEQGLPRNGLVLSLVSFNLGIELGQLTIVLALILPLAMAAARPWFRRSVLVPGSVVIAIFGAIWLAERVVGFKVLPI